MVAETGSAVDIKCVEAVAASWTMVTVVAETDSAVGIECVEALSVTWILVKVAVVGSWSKVLLM